MALCGTCGTSVWRSFWIGRSEAVGWCHPSGGAIPHQQRPWFPNDHVLSALSSTRLGEAPALLPAWSSRWANRVKRLSC